MNMKQACRTYIMMFLLLCITGKTHAQISAGGQPYSLKNQLSTTLPTNILPALDLHKIRKEDAQFFGTTRFAAPISVNFNLQNSGKWETLKNGDRIWRIKIQSSQALALAFLYDDFFIPVGASLYMYDENREQILGAYTSRNNKPSQKMMTGLIKGEVAILEYYEPKRMKGWGHFQISTVQHAYDTVEAPVSDDDLLIKNNDDDAFGYCTSLDCEINVNCEQGEDWQTVKKGVCRILMVLAEGMGYCSGTLMNNTSNDGTPYILSAFHCMDGYTPLYDFWRFDFNYEVSGCTNSVSEPDFQSIVGCQKRASRLESDFLLLELSESIPEDYDIFYNGWNRGGGVPFYSANVHHPRGDVKKISLDHNPSTIFPSPISWSNDITTPADHHFKVVYDEGTFEIGSSGGPLFDHNQRIIGQLHGGNANCDQFIAYFGRLHKSWASSTNDDERLRNWLDPGFTGISVLDGISDPTAESVSISGRIHTEDHQGIGGVTIFLAGGAGRTAVTDTSGVFLFVNLPPQEDYTLEINKDFNDVNGISTFDLIKVKKHILNEQILEGPYKMIAADANNSKSVSNLDLIKMRKVLLRIDAAFPETTSWRFVADDFEFSDPHHEPFEYNFPPFIYINNLTEDINVNFTGIKIGDVNGSVAPGE